MTVPAKPYRMEIDDNGDWHYFINDKPCDLYDYRQAVIVHDHAIKEHYAKLREERLSKPLGIYIGATFPAGVRHPQLASSPWDNSDNAKFFSFKDLDNKAAAMGMVGNATADENRDAHQGIAPLTM